MGHVCAILCPEAEEICSHRVPQLREVSAGHEVACWLMEGKRGGD